MAGISDKVLARRQKDLEGFTTYYQDRLDKMVGQHMKNLAPAWQNMANQLEKQVKQLYKEAGATQDPTKILTLQNKAKRLEALAAQLAQDLKTTSEKLQPYYTGAITNIFEDSYYFNAWGLEQAAQVGVNIPLLSKANVLGVIANPWLPDGANYSSRIRANADYIAKKARDTVAKAVAGGWSVNEAARAMRDVTGEGYFRNVTIMRTELNRAASLGSSYLYMENADILDGKRWNATLDSRTAPKDADNDGEIFDLDYDTPERPGVAGKRIPNHPNCRCKYSPVLSALGVSRKERIAREGDSKDSWGKNTYTKARTYREYAKKRGLPDLDERLANDNLTAYLRPGETVAAFNKKVTRWATTGGTVAITKPAWDAVNKVELEAITAQDEMAATNWADAVTERVKMGVDTEADVREVGAMVRKRITDRATELADELKKIDDRKEELIEILNAFDPSEYDTPKYLKYLEEMEAIRKASYETSTKLYAEQADALRDALKDIRPVGPKSGSKQPYVKGSSKEVKEAIDEVRNYLPTDWVEASNLRPLKAKKVKRGFYSEATFKDEEALKKAGYTLEQLTKFKRLDLVEDTIALSGSGKGMLRCAFHEMGHRMEDMIPGIKKLEKEFYARRTAGEALQWLGPGYKQSEKTRFDNFLKPYMGKDYGNKEDSFYELLSMGLEGAYRGSYDITQDPDFYDFILGLLATK